VGLSSILNSCSAFFGGVTGRSACKGFETTLAVFPPEPNEKMDGGAGLAGVPNVKGVVAFSVATGVLGAPNVKGAGLAGFVSLSDPAKVNGAGLLALASPDVALKANKLFGTGFGACTGGTEEVG